MSHNKQVFVQDLSNFSWTKTQLQIGKVALKIGLKRFFVAKVRFISFKLLQDIKIYNDFHTSINVGTLLLINCTPSLKGHNFLTQLIIIDQVLAHFEFIEIKAFFQGEAKATIYFG